MMVIEARNVNSIMKPEAARTKISLSKDLERYLGREIYFRKAQC